MPIEKEQKRPPGAAGAAAADIRDKATATLTFTDEEEELLGKGLGPILMLKDSDPERQKALAFESVKRDPDAALTIMNGNAQARFSEKPWAVELYRLAAEAATSPDMIFLAFPAIEKKPGALEALELMAAKYPAAAVKNLKTYYDHPKAETIFKAVMAASAEAQSAGQSQIYSWGSREPDIIKKYPWMQEIYLEVLLSQRQNKAQAVIHAAKLFGDLPWFRRAIDELPKLITTHRDLEWCLWQVTNFSREFPRGVAAAIKAKLDTVKL